MVVLYDDAVFAPQNDDGELLLLRGIYSLQALLVRKSVFCRRPSSDPSTTAARNWIVVGLDKDQLKWAIK